MPPVQFATQSYQARALPVSAQRCVNYFAEAQPPDAKTQVAVWNAPGTKLFSDNLAGAVRGSWEMENEAYFVAGNVLYRVDSAGVSTSLGTINTFNGYISMASNNAVPKQLCIVDGQDGWIYDKTSGLQQITSPNFFPASTVTFQDGYFAFPRDGTSEWFISNLNDGLTYTATDIATAESHPDLTLTVYENHGELWVFSEESIEVYYNSGNPDFPFDRIQGARLERGAAARFAVADEDNTLFWLGDDGVVYRAAGYTPKRISTHAIEEEIRGCPCWFNARAFFITISGHKLYHLTFPDKGKTFVYDVATDLWHERESVGTSYYRANTHVWAYEKHLVGDAFQGRIGELDLDTFTEYGETMQGILPGPPIHSDRKRVFHRRFEIDIESGVGITGADAPLMWLDYSDDGGRTWSLRKPFRSMGKEGEYNKRLRWLRLGQSRQRIYRLWVADPVKRSIIAAHWFGAVGSN